MANSDDFIAWASNPRLNIEEAFCAELIVEQALTFWRMQNHVRDPESFEAKRERRKQRALNPAHRVKLNVQDVERAASIVDTVPSFSATASKYTNDDRPLRDISGVRFLRGLKDFNVHGSELMDLAALAELPQLKSLRITDDELDDLRPISRCSALETLFLHLGQPWPQVASVETLPHLKQFDWKGNLFVLEGLGSLPHLTRASFDAGLHWKLPLRDLQSLPAMPLLRVFELSPAWSVVGINKWPTITNLSLIGNVRSFEPLHALSELTHLTIKTDRLRNVQQLTGIPQLRHLLVDSEYPVDFSSLTDAPKLHEIEVKGSDINKMEVATLNSVLTSWSEEFEAAQARPVPPLRIRTVSDRQVLKETTAEVASANEVEKDPGIFASEGRWMTRRLHSRLNRLIGSENWGAIDNYAVGHRTGGISIHSFETAERLRDIVQIARETMAQARHRWNFIIRISLQAEWQEKYPELQKELERQRIVEEHLTWEARQKQRKEFLERKHRAELLQQEGMKIKPEDFAAPETTEDAPDELDRLSFEEPESHPMAEQLDCSFVLSEAELVVGHRSEAAVKQLMAGS